MISYLLDSDVCIAALNFEPPVTEFLDSLHRGDVGLPAIVLAELHFGAMNSQRRIENLNRLGLFVERLPVIPFDESAAAFYGNLRADLQAKGTPIGPNDLFIAATALAREATLVTRNFREFSRVAGLRWQTV